MMKKKIFLSFFMYAVVCVANAQDSSRLHFTTGIGVIKVSHGLHDILKPSIAFNSGLELSNTKHLYLQGTVDFNSLRYDQRVKDQNSPYLFQNTNSSLLMLGVNLGKNFNLNHKWFFSAYAGGGYLNIGEPRVTLENSIIRQDVVRQADIFGRTGIRLAYKSPVRFLQTIYLDADWWTSPVKVQENRLNGFALFIGTRMGI